MERAAQHDPPPAPPAPRPASAPPASAPPRRRRRRPAAPRRSASARKRRPRGSRRSPPTTRRAGHASPIPLSPFIVPMAERLFDANSAVGGRSRAISRRVASIASALRKLPNCISAGSAASPACARAARYPSSRSRPVKLSGSPATSPIRRCPSPIRCAIASPHRRAVIEHHRVAVEAHQHPVNQHHRCAEALERRTQPRVLARRRHDQAVHLARPHQRDLLVLQRHVALVAAEHDHVPGRVQVALHPRHHIGVEWIGDVADREPDRMRQPRP